jgi:hypothetical protein
MKAWIKELDWPRAARVLGLIGWTEYEDVYGERDNPGTNLPAFAWARDAQAGTRESKVMGTYRDPDPEAWREVCADAHDLRGLAAMKRFPTTDPYLTLLDDAVVARTPAMSLPAYLMGLGLVIDVRADDYDEATETTRDARWRICWAPLFGALADALERTAAVELPKAEEVHRGRYARSQPTPKPKKKKAESAALFAEPPPPPEPKTCDSCGIGDGEQDDGDVAAAVLAPYIPEGERGENGEGKDGTLYCQTCRARFAEEDAAENEPEGGDEEGGAS